MVGGIEACPFFHYEVLAHHPSPFVSEEMAVEHVRPAIVADIGKCHEEVYFGAWRNENRVFLGRHVGGRLATVDIKNCERHTMNMEVVKCPLVEVAN